MIFWITKQIILSIILIAVIHYIYTFFKNNLTIPQVKDLINKPQKQYDEIYKTIKSENKSGENQDMKDELKKYLAEIQQQQQEPNTKEEIKAIGGTFDNNFSDAYQRL